MTRNMQVASVLVSVGAAFAVVTGCGGKVQNSSSCPEGIEGCPCYRNATCDDGLTCASDLCVNPGNGGEGAAGAEGAPGTAGSAGKAGTAGSARASGSAAGAGGMGAGPSVVGGGTGGGGLTTGSGATTSTSEGGTEGDGIAGLGCSRTPSPDERITDFSIWDAGNWGDATATLTGGSFDYDGDGDDAVDALTVTVEDEALHWLGTVPSWAGFGLWFGACTDASAYAGISFTISGSIDGGNIEECKFQVQTSKNYPIDTANNKGECEGNWNDPCASGTAMVTVTETPETVKLTWDQFIDGAPEPEVDHRELLGIQWEFNREACDVDVTVDDVQFIAE